MSDIDTSREAVRALNGEANILLRGFASLGADEIDLLIDRLRETMLALFDECAKLSRRLEGCERMLDIRMYGGNL